MRVESLKVYQNQSITPRKEREMGMTVKELIEELNKHPGNREVKVGSRYWGCEVDIDGVVAGYECIGDDTVILDVSLPGT